MISLLILILGQYYIPPVEGTPSVIIQHADHVTIVKPPCRPTLPRMGVFVGCMTGPTNSNDPCVSARWRPVYMVAPTDPVPGCEDALWDQIRLLTWTCKVWDRDADGDVDMLDFRLL